MKFNIEQIQFVFFLSTVNLRTQPMQVASEVIRHIPELSDVDPVIPPQPPAGVPLEFPRLVLRRLSGEGWAYQYAVSRCDFVYTLPQPVPIGESVALLLDIRSTLVKCWTNFQENLAWRASRLGMVTIAASILQNSGQLIAEKYFRSGVGTGAKEAFLGYLTQTTIDTVSVNHWIRLQTRPPRENQNEALMLNVDINTDSEVELDVTPTSLGKFFDISQKLINSDTELHEGAE